MRRRKVEGTSREGEWPAVSAPAAPACAAWYFSRLVGGTKQDLMVTNFRTEWQVGTFLRQVLDGAEIVNRFRLNGDDVIDYQIPTEQSRRTFRGMLSGGLSIDDCLSQSRDVTLPWHEDNWVRMSRGMPSRSFAAYAGGAEDVQRMPQTAQSNASEGSRRREPRDDTRRPARAPKIEGLVTLQNLCAEHSVEASDVRALLRRRNVPKPESGWSAPDGDPQLATWVDVIKAVKRGEKR